jgi:predicted dehydrogenase
MIKIGIIGYGYWGPNIARNAAAAGGLQLAAICDVSEDALKRAQKNHPGVRLTRRHEEITTSPEIDAVAVITPVSTHYGLMEKALNNGKHVFVEKPFTAGTAEAEKLLNLAEKKNLKIMVDHTFLFTGAVKKIKELIVAETLGRLLYYDSSRINLGLFQHDLNVIWDLAPHDIAIMDYLIQNKPVAVSAQGIDHFGRGKENIGYITIYFEDNMIAHFNLNWLSPVKIRLTLIGGAKKMLLWNDVDVDEKVKIYDKGVELKEKEGIYNALIDYRLGDMWSPKIDNTEALKVELNYFADYINGNFKAINDGHAGLRVVKLLEATDKSLKQRGKEIVL